jgi:IMP dehydrogenase
VHEIDLGGGRTARRAYDLDDITLVPSKRTRDRRTSSTCRGTSTPTASTSRVLSAPLDAVTSPATAPAARRPRWARRPQPRGPVDPVRGSHVEVLAEIAELEPGPAATVRLQELYGEPVKEELIGRRVEELKAGGYAAGSLTPQKVERYHGAALEAGLDLLVVQGVVVTAQHVGRPRPSSRSTCGPSPPATTSRSWSAGWPSAKSALHLMRTGAVGVLVGLGASSVSTTDAALGIHVPLATAIAKVAAARSRYLEESGRYVHVIAPAGCGTGGDLAKAIACGADAVMLGRPLAAAEEAPGGAPTGACRPVTTSCRVAATTASSASVRSRSCSRVRPTATTAR